MEYKSFRYLKSIDSVNGISRHKRTKLMSLQFAISYHYYLGMLFFGSSLSFASPPNRYTLLPIMVKLCPNRGQGGWPFLGAFGLSRFHSHLLA